ncbi:MAG: NAD(P)/FAD-dependent oxidoreductase [Cyanobacteriota bacterium]|nr:NAD(P)/FAD-dependent oxidoreductase [Cyanobacteriota bacterium]
MTSVAIIGAGPAGLTAAFLLAKAGFKPEIWEADPTYVGGISRTVVYKGFRFDIGGHRFFSKSAEIENLWTEILPSDMIVRERLSRIFYKNKYYQYPLEAAEVINNLGKREALRCVGSYLKRKVNPIKNVSNLEDWVTNQFGSRLYQTFFKTYTEKVWGTSCRNISADWAAQRIKGLSLSKAAWASLFSTSTPPVNSIDRQDLIKTLITSFRYPRLGPGMMWEAAVAHIKERGGLLHMGSKVIGLHLHQGSRHWSLSVQSGGDAIVQRHGPYDHVISSAPLKSIIAAVDPKLPTAILESAASLKYRDFILVALILRAHQTFPDQWLYIHDASLQVGRIQNFGNWSPELIPDPALACYGMEYFCSTNDRLWNLTNEELIQMATAELEALHLTRPGDVVDGCVVRQPKAYPVYDGNYENTVRILHESLTEHCPGLHQVGRNGMHKYNNQDHSMMTGILTARNIISNRFDYDPWRVNQDAEYLEAKD